MLTDRLNPQRVVLATPAPLTHRTAEENLGLGYLAAVLRRAGHRVEIVDGWLEGLGVEELARRIASQRPTLLGFACYRSNMDRAVAARRILVERGSTPFVVAGGYGPTFHTQEFLEAGFDAVVRGEGETPLAQLAEHMSAGTPALDDIAGLSYRDVRGGYRHHPRPSEKVDLDALPDPARDTLPLVRSRRSMVHVQTARGCLASCTFCSIVAFERVGGGVTWRERSLTRLVDELESLASLGVTHVKFVDDSLLEPPRGAAWCHALADDLHRRGIRMRLRGSLRADRVDDDVVAGLARAGFFSVACGIENFAPSALRRMAKRSDPDQNCRALDAFARHGLLVQSGHILFDDQTTIEELRANCEQMQRYTWTVTKGVFTEMYAAVGTNYTRRLNREKRLREGRDHLGNTSYQVLDPRARVLYRRLKRWHRSRNELYDRVIDPLSAPKALEPHELDQFHTISTRLRQHDLAVFATLLDIADSSPTTATLTRDSHQWLTEQIDRAQEQNGQLRAEVDLAYRQCGLVYDADPNPFLDTNVGA